MSSEYANIAKACFLVAIDNGGINRERSKEQQARDFRKWMGRQNYPNIAEIDAWLGSLTNEELDLFCVGGTGEPDADTVRARAPAFADDLLTSYFEEVC